MALYKRGATRFHTIDYAEDPLLLYLRQNAETLSPYDTEADIQEAFVVSLNILHDLDTKYKEQLKKMMVGGFLEMAPLTSDYSSMVFYFINDKTARPTVSKTHVKLPNINYLNCLTPNDFFSILRFIAESSTTASGTSFSTNANIELTPFIRQFFVFNDVTYKINPEYAAGAWISKKEIEEYANLEPTRDNQFNILQLIAAYNLKDDGFLPIDTLISLELDGEQINDDYAELKRGENYTTL